MSTLTQGPFWDFLNLELAYKAPWEHEEGLESSELEHPKSRTLPGNEEEEEEDEGHRRGGCP